MGWTEQLHPRNAKGPGGGEFKSGKASSSAPARSTRTAKAQPRGGGSMSYDGKTGTGYGKKGGDPRVKKLQQALNKLGIRDANGKRLAVDGKLGPLTTQAIKAWQRKNGMKPTGAISMADIKRMSSGGHKHTTAASIRARAAKKTTARAAKPAAPARRKAPTGPSLDTQTAIRQSVARQRG